MDSDSNQQRSWMQSMLRGVNRHQDIKKPQPKPIFRQKLTSIFGYLEKIYKPIFFRNWKLKDLVFCQKVMSIYVSFKTQKISDGIFFLTFETFFEPQEHCAQSWTACARGVRNRTETEPKTEPNRPNFGSVGFLKIYFGLVRFRFNKNYSDRFGWYYCVCDSVRFGFGSMKNYSDRFGWYFASAIRFGSVSVLWKYFGSVRFGLVAFEFGSVPDDFGFSSYMIITECL